MQRLVKFFKDLRPSVGIFLSAGLVLGIAVGLVLAPALARANFFQDLWQNLTSSFTESTSTVSQTSPVPLYKPALDYERAVVNAVKKASPAVVSITITKNVPIIEQCPYNPFSDLPPEFQQFFGGQQFYQPCEKGSQQQEVGGGSGFIISPDGLILTNKHVVLDKAASYTVLTNDGEKYDAEVLARDPSQDLAVLKIKAAGLPVVELGNSDSLELGQTAIAIGNALGEYRNTVSVGVISGLSRTVQASGPGIAETINGVIQTDTAINPGNSGGPLLNLNGQVVGINTAIASGAQNIGFAIPINDAKRDIDSIRKTGEIQVPYLGVRYITLNEDLAKKEGLPVSDGALIRGSSDGPAVAKDSPAAQAGLQAEDIITEVDGKKLSADYPLGRAISEHSVGDTMKLIVRRGERTLELPVTLAKRPAS